MARKSPTITQDELYPPDEEFARQDIDDARLIDLDVEQESPFLRAQKRVSVRRGSLPKKAAIRLKWAVAVLTGLLVLAIAAGTAYRYGEHSWRFRIESSDDIEITGIHSVTHSQIMEVLGGDIGRNIFFVPLAQRKTQLEQIPWIESASVMRFVPNRLKVEIHERTPAAFARVGSRILLTDNVGTLMELPGKKKYSFPVIVGMNTGEPPSTRAARMKIYNDVVSQLDSGGARYAQELSEIDLSDPDDVKVLANNRAGEVLVHLGSSSYLERYKVYVTHVQDWQQQFDKLESVDLRYDREIIVNPDLQGTAKQPPLSPDAAKKAMAAGVKPAALITRITAAPKPSPSLVVKTAVTAPAKLTPLKPVVSKKISPAGHRKAHLRQARLKGKAKARAKTVAAPNGQKSVGPRPAGNANANPSRSATKPVKPSPAIAKGEDPQ